MNEGAILWGAALAALILSVFTVAMGVGLLLLTALGVTPLLVGAFATVIALGGIGGVYVLYQWFTEGLE